MFAILHALGMFLADMFKSRGAGLEPRICFSAEKAGLRHQVVVLRRIVHGISLPLLCASSSTARLVCTESPIRIDWGRESPASAHNDRAAMFCPCRLGLAIQVEEPDYCSIAAYYRRRSDRMNGGMSAIGT